MGRLDKGRVVDPPPGQLREGLARDVAPGILESEDGLLRVGRVKDPVGREQERVKANRSRPRKGVDGRVGPVKVDD